MRHLADLRTLTALVTVAREGNVTRAAKALHLTQPAVTLQLKKLSEACGTTLFLRTPKGLELTEDGAALAKKAEKVLSAMTEFDVGARHLTGSVEGRIRLGTIIDPDFIRLGGLLAELTATAPRLHTELVHGVSGAILDRLLRNDIDAGFFLGELDTTEGAEPVAQKLRVQQLTRFSYYIVAPPGWEERVRGKDWPALMQLPWIGTPPASVHNRLLTPIFAQHGQAPKIVATVDQELSMLAMVQSGVGLSLCRDSLALYQRQANGLAIADLVEIETSLSFLSLEARRGDPRIEAVCAAISRIWPARP